MGEKFDRLRIGSEVTFSEEKGEKGPQATTVKLIRPASQMRSAAGTVPVPTRKPARRKSA